MPLCSSKPLIFVWSLFNQRKEDSPHESCNVYTTKDASIPDHCHAMEMIPNAKTAGGGSVARKEGREEGRKGICWQRLWKALLQNHSPVGEPPTACWQHPKILRRSMHGMQNSFTEDSLGRRRSFYLHQPCGKA